MFCLKWCWFLVILLYKLRPATTGFFLDSINTYFMLNTQQEGHVTSHVTTDRWTNRTRHITSKAPADITWYNVKERVCCLWATPQHCFKLFYFSLKPLTQNYISLPSHWTVPTTVSLSINVLGKSVEVVADYTLVYTNLLVWTDLERNILTHV